MNLENIFSTRERLKILDEVLFRTEHVSVNQIADKLKLSKGLVSKYLEILVQDGVAKRASGKLIVNQTSPLVKGIKVLLNIGRIHVGLFKKYGFVQGVGIYGSCAKGENAADSDVDLWIRVKEWNEERQAVLASALRKKIKNVKALFLSNEKIKRLKKEDELFYHALSFGSIILYGSQNALEL